MLTRGVVVVALFSVCAAACGGPVMPSPPPPFEPVTVDYSTDGTLAGVGASEDDRPFYAGTSYDPKIATAASLIGHPVGALPARPEAIVRAFRSWAESSPRATIATYARTYEGRELVRIIISSPENIARLDTLQADMAKLADPRTLSRAETVVLTKRLPAVGWFGYSIHGNEVSGSDAALAFGYHLIAGNSSEVRELLEKVIVIIDPVMNPDGRARTRSVLDQTWSRRPSENYGSMHRFRWPYGRGNHYLFDLNRDWIVGVHPETRGRWKEMLAWNPQLIVDAHEMGARDTYLFSPKSEPHNPNLPAWHARWYKVFAADLGRAFDARGWAYYTREWADGWFPGYTTTWGQLLGALTFLYEQSSTRGLPLRRPSGQRVTYRDSVRGHAVSSLANLRTLANNREAMLLDFVDHKRAWSDARTRKRVFALKPGVSPDRERALLSVLLRLGIEVYRADAAFKGKNALTTTGERTASHALPAGTYLIPEAQPNGAVVRALLSLDPRIDAKALTDERRELERNGRSKIYDVTAWNLPHAFAVQGAWIDRPTVKQSALAAQPAVKTGAVATSAKATPYGWVVDGLSDGSVAFAARATELGLDVHVADRPFAADNHRFARGSVLVRRAENASDTADRVDQSARFAGVSAQPVMSGRAPGDAPDLGGHHFHRLVRPRIALLSSGPISSSGFGHLWHHLDQRLGVPITMLDAQSLPSADLRRYNVLIVPAAGAGLAPVLRSAKGALAAWVRQGGTLVAIAGSASSLASDKLALSAVRRRRDVLDTLALYQADAARALASREIKVEHEAIWSGSAKPGTQTAAGKDERAAEKAAAAPKPAGPASPSPAEQRDAWERRFSPQGAMLRGLVDDEQWITFGASREMPVLFAGSTAYMATTPVRVAVRLAPSDRLRLSGLLWPEARARLAATAYLTVERVGSGQVVLFASDPVFRGATRGTARLFSNAVVYGPGVGARQPDQW